MTCRNIDFDDRLNEIKEHYKMVEEIKNSLAEKRSKYREFAENIKIDQQSLFECCDNFEKSLLINCYTFMEQCFKSFIYNILEKDYSDNEYINSFINNKLSEDKFSPNVNLDNMKKIVREFFNINVDFLVDLNSDKVKKYIELIGARHRYAHRGIYDFDFENFKGAIEIIGFLRYIFDLYLKEKNEVNFSKLLYQIKNICIEIIKIKDILLKKEVPKEKKDEKKKKLEEKIKNLKESYKIFYEKYNNGENVILLKNLYQDLKKIENLTIDDVEKTELIENIDKLIESF